MSRASINTLQDRLQLAVAFDLSQMHVQQTIDVARRLQLWPTVVELQDIQHKLIEANRRVTEAGGQTNESR